MEDYTARSRGRRVQRRRRRRAPFVMLILLLLLGAGLWWRFGPQPYYSARHFGITELRSDTDADGDGVDDYTDLMLGARAYIETDPHYQSAYYVGGYPTDGCGVCTDVVWQAFRAAGYELKELVDADIRENPEVYTNIAEPDPNIDFRRVTNLNHYFSRHAESLTTDFDDPAQWQPGDIVIFGNCDHIAVCSDKRNRSGIPFIIHHGNPIDEAVERDQIGNQPVTAHYRWNGL